MTQAQLNYDKKIKDHNISAVLAAETYLRHTPGFWIHSHPEFNGIVFLDSEVYQYRQVDPNKFFVFFPGDVYRPCMKSGERSAVKKVVAKVRIS